nr:hypothetical protein [Myxococcales bacterium]
DNEDCTTDSCNKISGACTNLPYLGSCDDGNACTVGDSCGKDPDKGVHTCIPGLDQPKCDDKNPCTDDLCDTQKGCVNTANAGSQPCYTGDLKTKDVGECKSGVSYCKDGKLQGPCVNETLPKTKEACDGKDQNCDGITDEGCAPTSVNLTFIAAKIQGQSAKLNVEMLVGQSSPSGDSANNKYTMSLGFLAWLQALTK